MARGELNKKKNPTIWPVIREDSSCCSPLVLLCLQPLVFLHGIRNCRAVCDENETTAYKDDICGRHSMDENRQNKLSFIPHSLLDPGFILLKNIKINFILTEFHYVIFYSVSWRRLPFYQRKSTRKTQMYPLCNSHSKQKNYARRRRVSQGLYSLLLVYRTPGFVYSIREQNIKCTFKMWTICLILMGDSLMNSPK
jgi:hypothetical protein